MERKKEFDMMFDAIDDDAKRYVLAVLQGEFERTRRSTRPRLRLVPRATTDLPNHQVNALPVGGAG